MRRILVATMVALTVSACGHSEDEWQRQLAQYGQLNDQYSQEKAAHAATVAELDRVKAEVETLTQKLTEMGVNVDDLSQKLVMEGTEKERLSSDVEQLQQAIAEYKERANQLELIRSKYDVLRQKLEKLTNLGLKVQIRHNRMVILLPGDVLFSSGEDKLTEAGTQVLKAVSEVIRNDSQLAKRFFQVAGHTDAHEQPKRGRFADNWGLSAMRARQVLVYLVSPTDSEDGGGGLNPAQLHAAGYGETDPIADNETDTGRQANRRVELVLMPDVEEMLDLKSLL